MQTWSARLGGRNAHLFRKLDVSLLHIASAFHKFVIGLFVKWFCHQSSVKSMPKHLKTAYDLPAYLLICLLASLLAY